MSVPQQDPHYLWQVRMCGPKQACKRGRHEGVPKPDRSPTSQGFGRSKQRWSQRSTSSSLDWTRGSDVTFADDYASDLRLSANIAAEDLDAVLDADAVLVVASEHEGRGRSSHLHDRGVVDHRRFQQASDTGDACP